MKIPSRHPVVAQCPHCHHSGMTLVKKANGVLVYGIAGLCSPFCCFIPFLGDCFKDSIHYCDKCGNVLSTVSKIEIWLLIFLNFKK